MIWLVDDLKELFLNSLGMVMVLWLYKEIYLISGTE